MCNYFYIVQSRVPPYSTVQSIPQLPNTDLNMCFTNLLCSHQPLQRTHWEVTSQCATLLKLWEAQRAPANHVNASPRTTFPDASVFPLHWCVTARVCGCVHVCVWARISYRSSSMNVQKWVTAANIRPFSQNRGFPWAGRRSETSASTSSSSRPHPKRLLTVCFTLMEVRGTQTQH